MVVLDFEGSDSVSTFAPGSGSANGSTWNSSIASCESGPRLTVEPFIITRTMPLFLPVETMSASDRESPSTTATGVGVVALVFVTSPETFAALIWPDNDCAQEFRDKTLATSTTAKIRMADIFINSSSKFRYRLSINLWRKATASEREGSSSKQVWTAWKARCFCPGWALRWSAK